MSRPTRCLLTTIVTATALLAGACGRADYSRDDAIADLEDQNLTPEQAGCVADAVIAEFGLDMLDEDPEPTPEQVDRLQEISAPCLTSS